MQGLCRPISLNTYAVCFSMFIEYVELQFGFWLLGSLLYVGVYTYLHMYVYTVFFELL